MAVKGANNRSTMFRIGLGILLFWTAGNILGHIGLAVFDSGPKTVFIDWAALNLIALIHLLIPYRRTERWAWYVIWVLIVPYASVILFNTDFGPIYLGEAVLMAIAQLLTYREFFAAESHH